MPSSPKVYVINNNPPSTKNLFPREPLPAIDVHPGINRTHLRPLDQNTAAVGSMERELPLQQQLMLLATSITIR
jgi:hypothetical protein